MCINLLIFLLHRYVSKLDILRTQYLKNRRMKCIDLALTMYMSYLLDIKGYMKTLSTGSRIWLDIKYIKTVIRVVWILIQYKFELSNYMRQLHLEKIQQSKIVLDHLKLAA